MTKQNQLFEAIGYIDDSIAERAINSIEQKKRKKPITLIAIAAAAAVLSMIVGFAAKNDAFEISFHGNNISQRGFTATLTDQQFNIPVEFESMRNYQDIGGFVDMLPSEVYEKVGLTMLTSENFTETKDVKMRRSIASGEQHSWEPQIWVHGKVNDYLSLQIEYCLYDKIVGANVWFRADYIADNERLVWNGADFDFNAIDTDADIVKLNNGELAMVSDDTAAFVLDGIYYRLDFDDYKNENIATIDNMKQVLADLGIYTPAEEAN